MKKLAIATMVAFLALPTIASGNPFVQLDWGKSDFDINKMSKKTDDLPMSSDIRFGLGYRKGDSRIMLDYTKLGKIEFPGYTNVTLDTRSLGLSYIYDFNNSTSFLLPI